MIFTSEERYLDEYPDYKFNDFGHVFSRKSKKKGLISNWKRIYGTLDKDGYSRLYIYSISGNQINKHLHILICTAFHGECPTGMECSHLNGNKQDNRPVNLKWKLHISNVHDRYEHGTMCLRSKKTPEITNDMRLKAFEYIDLGFSASFISSELNISLETVTQMKYGFRDRQREFLENDKNH